jgi:RimJ/RimL family protein N-acetyltransferase
MGWPMPLALRPFEERDFASLISWVPTADELVQWSAAFFRLPLDEDQLRRHLESTRNANTLEIFTVAQADRAVAHIELSMIWPHLSCRLSRVLVAPGERSRGIGRKTVRLAVSHGFERYHVDRIDLGVADDNEAAIGCYRREGFVHVGTWPRAMTIGTRTINVAWMTLTRSAWARDAGIRAEPPPSAGAP